MTEMTAKCVVLASISNTATKKLLERKRTWFHLKIITVNQPFVGTIPSLLKGCEVKTNRKIIY